MAFIPLASLQPEPELRPAGALDERRQHPRLPVQALTLYAADGRAYRGRGDLSVGGVLWMGEGRPPLGVQVELGLRIPGHAREVRVRAAVCHVQHGDGITGVHARFCGLPADIHDAIASAVDDWFFIADASGLLAV